MIQNGGRISNQFFKNMLKFSLFFTIINFSSADLKINQTKLRLLIKNTLINVKTKLRSLIEDTLINVNNFLRDFIKRQKKLTIKEAFKYKNLTEALYKKEAIFIKNKKFQDEIKQMRKHHSVYNTEKRVLQRLCDKTNRVYMKMRYTTRFIRTLIVHYTTRYTVRGVLSFFDLVFYIPLIMIILKSIGQGYIVLYSNFVSIITLIKDITVFIFNISALVESFILHVYKVMQSIWAVTFAYFDYWVDLWVFIPSLAWHHATLLILRVIIYFYEGYLRWTAFWKQYFPELYTPIVEGTTSTIEETQKYYYAETIQLLMHKTERLYTDMIYEFEHLDYNRLDIIPLLKVKAHKLVFGMPDVTHAYIHAFKNEYIHVKTVVLTHLTDIIYGFKFFLLLVINTILDIFRYIQEFYLKYLNFDEALSLKEIIETTSYFLINFFNDFQTILVSNLVVVFLFFFFIIDSIFDVLLYIYNLAEVFVIFGLPAIKAFLLLKWKILVGNLLARKARWVLIYKYTPFGHMLQGNVSIITSFVNSVSSMIYKLGYQLYWAFYGILWSSWIVIYTAVFFIRKFFLYVTVVFHFLIIPPIHYYIILPLKSYIVLPLYFFVYVPFVKPSLSYFLCVCKVIFLPILLSPYSLFLLCSKKYTVLQAFVLQYKSLLPFIKKIVLTNLRIENIMLPYVMVYSASYLKYLLLYLILFCYKVISSLIVVIVTPFCSLVVLSLLPFIIMNLIKQICFFLEFVIMNLNNILFYIYAKIILVDNYISYYIIKMPLLERFYHFIFHREIIPEFYVAYYFIHDFIYIPIKNLVININCFLVQCYNDFRYLFIEPLSNDFNNIISSYYLKQNFFFNMKLFILKVIVNIPEMLFFWFNSIYNFLLLILCILVYSSLSLFKILFKGYLIIFNWLFMLF